MGTAPSLFYALILSHHANSDDLNRDDSFVFETQRSFCESRLNAPVFLAVLGQDVLS
jgi:hypothetical protein